MKPDRNSGGGSHIHFLDFGGVCFLCLKYSKLPSEEEEVNMGGFNIFKKCSLLKISRFLQIDIDRIYPEIFINSKLDKRKNEVFVSLCEQCLGVYNLFDELYNILEETDILMKGCINKIHQVIQEGQKDPVRQEEMKRIPSVTEDDVKIIESLRMKIMFKSQRHLKSSAPIVQLSRLSDDEIKRWKLKRSVPTSVLSVSSQVVTKHEPQPMPLEVNDFIIEEESFPAIDPIDLPPTHMVTHPNQCQVAEPVQVNDFIEEEESSPAIEWNEETSYSYSDMMEVDLPPTDIEFPVNQFPSSTNPSSNLNKSIRTSTSSLEDSDFVSCPYCKFKVSKARRANLTTHLANNHVEHFLPNLFPKVKITLVEFQAVVKRHVERFIVEDHCSICNKTYNISAKYLLLLHMRTHLLKDHGLELERSLTESLSLTNSYALQSGEVNQDPLEEQLPPNFKASELQFHLNQCQVAKQPPPEVIDFIEEESSSTMEWLDETSDLIDLPPTDIELNLNQSTSSTLETSSKAPEALSTSASQFISCPCCAFQVQRIRRSNLNTHLVNNHVEHFFPNLFSKVTNKITLEKFQEVVKSHLERFIDEDTCSLCNKKYQISSRYLLVLHLKIHLLHHHRPELEKSLKERFSLTKGYEVQVQLREVHQDPLEELAPSNLKSSEPPPTDIQLHLSVTGSLSSTNPRKEVLVPPGSVDSMDLPPTEIQFHLNQSQVAKHPPAEVIDFIEEESSPTMEWLDEASDLIDLPPTDIEFNLNQFPSTSTMKTSCKAPKTRSTSASKFVSCPCCEYRVKPIRRSNLNTHLVNNHVEHFFPNLFPQVKMTLQLAEFQEMVQSHLERFIKGDTCSLCNKKYYISSRYLLVLHLKIHLLHHHGAELEKSLKERLSSTNPRGEAPSSLKTPIDLPSKNVACTPAQSSTSRRSSKEVPEPVSTSASGFVSCPHCRFQVSHKRRANLTTHLVSNHVEHFFPSLYPRMKISLVAFQNMVVRHIKLFIEQDNCSLCKKTYNISSKTLKFLHMKAHLLSKHGPELKKSLMERSSSLLAEAVKFEDEATSSSSKKLKIGRKPGRFKCSHCPWSHRERVALTHHTVAQHPEHYFPNVFQKLEISFQNFKFLLNDGVTLFIKGGKCTLCGMKCNITREHDQYRYLKGHLLWKHRNKLEEKLIEIGKLSPEKYQTMTSKSEAINMLPALLSSASVQVAKVNEVSEVIPESASSPSAKMRISTCPYCSFINENPRRLHHHFGTNHPEHYFPNVIQKLQVSLNQFKTILDFVTKQFIKDDNCALCSTKYYEKVGAEQYLHVKVHLLLEHNNILEKKIMEIARYEKLTSEPAFPSTSSAEVNDPLGEPVPCDDVPEPVKPVVKAATKVSKTSITSRLTCRHCGKKFARPINVRYHVLIKHKDVYFPSMKKDNVTDSQYKLIIEHLIFKDFIKNLNCTLCPKKNIAINKYWQLLEVKTHLIHKHREKLVEKLNEIQDDPLRMAEVAKKTHGCQEGHISLSRTSS